MLSFLTAGVLGSSLLSDRLSAVVLLLPQPTAALVFLFVWFLSDYFKSRKLRLNMEMLHFTKVKHSHTSDSTGYEFEQFSLSVAKYYAIV